MEEIKNQLKFYRQYHLWGQRNLRVWTKMRTTKISFRKNNLEGIWVPRERKGNVVSDVGLLCLLVAGPPLPPCQFPTQPSYAFLSDHLILRLYKTFIFFLDKTFFFVHCKILFRKSLTIIAACLLISLTNTLIGELSVVCHWISGA